ncbi:hypothetical protein V6N12_065138 [Hibiscus sabdariffa]|uniref:Uncharacterized protein n=1 Tax=Hibiscus sabdariffa TaxID=183260 RepID=A0ABR2G7U0_9ROSI
MKQGLELGSSQERNGNNVAASVWTNIYNEMTLWDIQREALFVIALPPSQAGASLEDLLDDCCLRQLVGFVVDSHLPLSWGERGVGGGIYGEIEKGKERHVGRVATCYLLLVGIKDLGELTPHRHSNMPDCNPIAIAYWDYTTLLPSKRTSWSLFLSHALDLISKLFRSRVRFNIISNGSTSLPSQISLLNFRDVK